MGDRLPAPSRSARAGYWGLDPVYSPKERGPPKIVRGPGPPAGPPRISSPEYITIKAIQANIFIKCFKKHNRYLFLE